MYCSTSRRLTLGKTNPGPAHDIEGELAKEGIHRRPLDGVKKGDVPISSYPQFHRMITVTIGRLFCKRCCAPTVYIVNNCHGCLASHERCNPPLSPDQRVTSGFAKGGRTPLAKEPPPAFCKGRGGGI